MIGEIADERVRVEDVDLRRLCEKHGLGSANECRRPVKEESVKKVSHGGNKDNVPWSEVEGIDPALALKMWELAQSYGYNRDPPGR